MCWNEDPFTRDELRHQRQRRERQRELAPTVAKSLAAIRSLQDSGWKLSDDSDLDAIDTHIRNVCEVYNPLEVGTDVHSLVSSCRQAVRNECIRRDLENRHAIERQRNRIRVMLAAAESFERALQLLDQAEGIEDRRDLIPRATIQSITDADAREMDDARLRQMEHMESRERDSLRSGAESIERKAALLERCGGSQGKRLAKVLRATAKESREDAATHQANASVLHAEAERRAKLAEPVDVHALQARIAELEAAARAADSGQG